MAYRLLHTAKRVEKHCSESGGANDKKNDEADKSVKGKKEQTDSPPSRSSSSDNKPKSAPANDWSFGMFGQTASNKNGGSSVGGKPIGGENNEKEKWLVIGALSVVALIGGLAFMKIGYR